jgi:hypothetical protein
MKAGQRLRACSVREGVADLARHPLNDPTPAGATDAGVGVAYGKQMDRQARRLSGISWDGHEARPVEVDGRRGRRLPAARPNLKTSAVADRQSDEAGVVTRFHPQQHGTFAFRARAGDFLAHVGGRGNGLAGDLQNDVAGREAVIGGDPG